MIFLQNSKHKVFALTNVFRSISAVLSSTVTDILSPRISGLIHSGPNMSLSVSSKHSRKCDLSIFIGAGSAKIIEIKNVCTCDDYVWVSVIVNLQISLFHVSNHINVPMSAKWVTHLL